MANPCAKYIKLDIVFELLKKKKKNTNYLLFIYYFVICFLDLILGIYVPKDAILMFI